MAVLKERRKAEGRCRGAVGRIEGEAYKLGGGVG